MPPIAFACPGCNRHLEAPDGTAGQVTDCPSCNKAISIPGVPPTLPPPVLPSTPVARIIKKGEIAGIGAAIQAVGVILFALFFFISGELSVVCAVVGIILLVVGGRMAHKLLCSACGNKVEKTSRLCPACRSPLQAAP